MEVESGELGFDNETDDARWLSPGKAAEMLSYSRDIDVLNDATERR